MVAAAQSEHTQPTHISPAVAETHILARSYPSEPREAEAARISGTVILEVAISPSGDVDSARVISGHPLLAPRAVEAVRSWKFEPFVQDGMAVEVTTEVTVGFSPPPLQTSWYFELLLVAPYVSLTIAWVQRSRDGNRQSHWRSNFLFIGLLVLTVSLANLSAELIYRFVAGHKLGITPAIEVWAAVNGMACLVAGILCLVGKGPGRFVSFLAAPLLVFIWTIHVVF